MASQVLQEKGNYPILYRAFGSFYSRKAMFAFHEKGVKFTSCIIDINKGEQCEPWYMELNPLGKVPVIKVQDKVISESSVIIEYLDKNFDSPGVPPLIPDEARQGISEMENVITEIPMGIVTFGCLFFPELTVDMKLSETERKARIERFQILFKTLDKFALKYPELKEKYMTKKQGLQVYYSAAQDKNKVLDAMNELGKALNKIEKVLNSQEPEGWLCAKTFTSADICLAIVLERVDSLGLWSKYFANEQLSRLNNFYKRVTEKESFKKTFADEMS